MIDLNALAKAALASRTRAALVGLTAVGAAAIAYDHRIHVIGALPYLLLLACPLMHLFMMHGHGGHAHGDKVTSEVLARDRSDDNQPAETEKQK
jgi:hypothetical protein